MTLYSWVAYLKQDRDATWSNTRLLALHGNLEFIVAVAAAACFINPKHVEWSRQQPWLETHLEH
eukprot:3869-Amphidinium_carterae.1